MHELERTVRDLSARLRRVEDVEAIRELKARYGEVTDSRYREGVLGNREALGPIADEIASMFSEDAVWDGGPALGLCEGRAAIRERFLEPTLQFAHHFFVKPRIEVDGDRARGRWDILAPCTTLDGRACWMAGVEDDEYVRVDGLWLHSRMQLEMIFMAPYDRGWVKQPRPSNPDRGTQS